MKTSRAPGWREGSGSSGPPAPSRPPEASGQQRDQLEAVGVMGRRQRPSHEAVVEVRTADGDAGRSLACETGGRSLNLPKTQRDPMVRLLHQAAGCAPWRVGSSLRSRASWSWGWPGAEEDTAVKTASVRRLPSVTSRQASATAPRSSRRVRSRRARSRSETAATPVPTPAPRMVRLAAVATKFNNAVEVRLAALTGRSRRVARRASGVLPRRGAANCKAIPAPEYRLAAPASTRTP